MHRSQINRSSVVSVHHGHVLSHRVDLRLSYFISDEYRILQDSRTQKSALVIYQSSSGGSRPVRFGSSSSSLLSSSLAFRNRSSISLRFFSCSDMTLAAGTNFFLAAVSVLGACETDGERPSAQLRVNMQYGTRTYAESCLLALARYTSSRHPCRPASPAARTPLADPHRESRRIYRPGRNRACCAGS